MPPAEREQNVRLTRAKLSPMSEVVAERWPATVLSPGRPVVGLATGAAIAVMALALGIRAAKQARARARRQDAVHALRRRVAAVPTESAHLLKEHGDLAVEIALTFVIELLGVVARRLRSASPTPTAALTH